MPDESRLPVCSHPAYCTEEVVTSGIKNANSLFLNCTLYGETKTYQKELKYEY
jgi:hypothetical protein